MPRGFTEREMERIHQALIEAGMERLRTVGVHKTTVEELTKAARISKGAFYKFYPSKEALFFRIMEIYEARLKEKFFVLVSANPPQEVMGNLKETIKNLVFSKEMEDFLLIMKKDEMEVVFNALEPEMIEGHQGRDMDFVKTALTLLQSLGVPIKADPDEIQALLSGMICLFFGRNIITDKYFAIIMDRYIDMLIHALK